MRLIRQLLAPFAAPGQPALSWGALQPAAVARLQAGDGAAQAVPYQPAAQPAAQQQPQAEGQAREAPGPPLAKRAKRNGAGDMQYFLQLQRGVGGGGAVAGQPSGPPSSSSSGEASAEEAVAAHLQQVSTAEHSVGLPAVHAQLLRLLREDEQRLVAAAPAPGVPAYVACSDFLSVDALQRALQAAAGDCCWESGNWRAGLAQPCTSELSIVYQAACLYILLHLMQASRAAAACLSCTPQWLLSAKPPPW